MVVGWSYRDTRLQASTENHMTEMLEPGLPPLIGQFALVTLFLQRPLWR